MVRTKKKNKADEGDGEQSLLYNRVQEGFSGEVTWEQRLVWVMEQTLGWLGKVFPAEEEQEPLREEGTREGRKDTRVAGLGMQGECGSRGGNEKWVRSQVRTWDLILRALWEVRGKFYQRTVLN